MKHYKITYQTELKKGDYILLSLSSGQVWAEIYNITIDSGIITSHGNVCRSEIQDVEPQTLHYSI